MQHADSLSDKSSILMKATAAYARHVAGDSRAAFDHLMALIDGSETDEVLARSLNDMGTVIDTWLVEVAMDVQALPASAGNLFLGWPAS